MRFKPLAALALIALAACERSADAPDAADPANEAEVAAAVEIAATDEFGPFEARVNDIAFWTHPTLSFNGMALVATEAGLVALNIEDGAEVARFDIGAIRAIDVGYAGAGASARGYVGMATADGFRLAEIDNETRALALIGAPQPALGDARGFCMAGAGAGLVRYDVGRDGWRARPLLTEGETGAGGGALVDCAAMGGALVVIDPVGGLSVINPFTDERSASGDFAGADAIGLIFNRAAVSEAEVRHAVLFDRESGAVKVIALEGGAVGVARISASFDYEAVVTATAMGLGSGNFGGVYRDGVLAMATNGEAPVVRLVPFNGVMDALGAPVGSGVDQRALSTAAEEDDTLVIDVNLVTE